MRVAVVGHVEWLELAKVEHVPAAGEIVHAMPQLAVAAGGGAVAAVQLARWGATCTLFTALGDDELGRRARAELSGWGVDVQAVVRPEPQRRAITLIDAQSERTIIVLGDRLVPHGDDRLPWDILASCDAVYVTGGDAAAVRHARRARVLVATSRVLPLLREADVAIDALVGSDVDAAETYAPGDLPIAPALVVRTEGAVGGYYLDRDGVRHRYAAVCTEVRGDTYGAGDTFAAGLTHGLGQGRSAADAIAFAAARAAEVLAFEGPYPARS